MGACCSLRGCFGIISSTEAQVSLVFSSTVLLGQDPMPDKAQA